MSEKRGHTVYRDSDSGQLVAEDYASRHTKNNAERVNPDPGRGATGHEKKK